MAKETIKNKAKNIVLTLSNNEARFFKYAFIVLAAAIFIVRPLLSNHYGPSSDEMYHKAIGDLSYDYLASGGKDDSIFRYVPNNRDDASLLLNYGPLLEVVSAAVYKNLHTDPFPTRHLVLTLFTFLLFFYCGLTAYKIGGWRAGVFAMLFMVVSPRIFGEAFNNAKDPSFAAGYMMGIYGLLCFVEELPKPSWKSTIITMIGFGLAFAVRVGGLLLFAYLFLFVGLALLRNKEYRTNLFKINFKYYGNLLLKIGIILVGTWLIGIMAWPAALRDPIGQPLHALDVQSSYPTVIRLLFGGEYIQSNEVPWNYNPTYIFLTSPIIVILGLGIGILLTQYMRKIYNGYALIIILFISLFPIFYIIYKDSALYNGWRHSYFTYTGLVVYSALAFDTLLRIVKKPVVKYLIYAGIGIGVLLPTLFMVRNFPVVYVYFNEFAGGVDGTYGDYQLDYYACSAKPIADWFTKNIPYDANVKILSNNPWELNECFKTDKSKWSTSYVRFRERNEKNWDYAIFLPQFVDPQMMKKGYFPPAGTIHTFKVDNSVVACVVKRISKDDMIGIDALKKNDIPTAITHLEQAVKDNSTNEIAWAYLGIAYASAGRMQEAKHALSTSISISPEYQLPQQYYQQLMQGHQ